MSSLTMQRLLIRLRPTPVQLRDGAAALVLLVLALTSFRAPYGGVRVVIVGGIAALIGIAVGYCGARLRWNALLLLAAGLVAYFMFGGPLAAPGKTLLGLPTPNSFSALVDGAVNGWANLIRTLPAVGSAGNVLAVPVVCGLVGGLVSMYLATRTERAGVVTVPASAVLVTGVLFGTRHPVSVVLEGAAFAAVAMWWVSERTERGRVVLRQVSNTRRVVYTAGMVVFAGVVAVMIGPSLPVLASRDRYVLREHTAPHFDPRNYPSPLVSYRRYVVGDHKDEVAVRITGLPAGQPIRLATLDDYNGVVWGTGSGPGGAGRFRAIGSSLPVKASGETKHITIEIGSLRGVWLPTVGEVSRVVADDATITQLRFNETTGALARPLGDISDTKVYNLDVVAPPEADRAAAAKNKIDGKAAAPTLVDVPKVIQARAVEIVNGKSTPLEQASTLEAALKGGYYSDGDTLDPIASGHSFARLNPFVNGLMVGDAEQYAAAMAVMANSLGLPARVVVGFRPNAASGSSIEVHNSELTAWVEIPFENVGWVPFFPTPDRSKTPPPLQNITTTTSDGGKAHTTPPALSPELPESQAKPPSTTLPPCKTGGIVNVSNTAGTTIAPTTTAIPASTAAVPSGSTAGRNTCPSAASGPGIPHWLVTTAEVGGSGLLLLAIPPSLIVLAKRRRRNRRRTRPDIAGRVAGAWDELLDRLHDFGTRPAVASTRGEAARAIATPSALALAADADLATFGDRPLDASFDDTYWQRIDETVASIVSQHKLRARWRAAVSTASLRRGRMSSGESA